MEEEILNALKECGQDDARLAAELERLAEQWGDPVFQVVLRLLAGKEFDLAMARRYWREALRYREKSPNGIGLRSALLDYLYRVAGEIHDPRIMEAGQLEALRQASVTDGLTGLYQQGYFKAFLAREIATRRTIRTTLAVVLFDLDHFKQYNDRCGHLAGDRALSRTAEIIRSCTREGDLIARYGGEEFALLLPQVNRQQAFKVAERIRAAVEKAGFQGQELLDRGNLTISGGIAFFPGEGDSAEGLIAEADRQLYQAKVRRNAVAPTHRDRRRVHRQKLRSVLEIGNPAGSFEPGLTFDISEMGLTVGCGFDLPPGAEIRLRFSEPFWPRYREVLARVKNLRREAETGLILVGLEFDSSVRVDDLGSAARQSDAPPPLASADGD